MWSRRSSYAHKYAIYTTYEDKTLEGEELIKTLYRFFERENWAFWSVIRITESWPILCQLFQLILSLEILIIN